MENCKKMQLTPEDKERFREAAKTLTPDELLCVADCIKYSKDCFSEADLRFMRSCLGRRGEKLLRNVAKNFSWED